MLVVIQASMSYNRNRPTDLCAARAWSFQEGKVTAASMLGSPWGFAQVGAAMSAPK